MSTSLNADAAVSHPKDGLKPAPYTDGFVEAGGLKLHFADFGTAGRPPMLCIHGGAANTHWFDYIAPEFRADHRVLALDLRGHGDSEWSPVEDYKLETLAADVAALARFLPEGFDGWGSRHAA